jgi:hypothetical protein
MSLIYSSGIVGMLLDKQPEVIDSDSDDSSALHYAAQKNSRPRDGSAAREAVGGGIHTQQEHTSPAAGRRALRLARRTPPSRRCSDTARRGGDGGQQRILQVHLQSTFAAFTFFRLFFRIF